MIEPVAADLVPIAKELEKVYRQIDLLEVGPLHPSSITFRVYLTAHSGGVGLSQSRQHEHQENGKSGREDGADAAKGGKGTR